MTTKNRQSNPRNAGISLRLSDLPNIKVRGFEVPDGQYLCIAISKNGTMFGITDSIPKMMGTNDIGQMGSLLRELREAKQQVAEKATMTGLIVETLGHKNPNIKERCSELLSESIPAELKTLATELGRDRVIVERLRSFMGRIDADAPGFGVLYDYIEGISEVAKLRLETYVLEKKILSIDDALIRLKLVKSIFMRLKSFVPDRTMLLSEWNPLRILFGDNVEKLPVLSLFEIYHGVWKDDRSSNRLKELLLGNYNIPHGENCLSFSSKPVQTDEAEQLSSFLKAETIRLIPTTFLNRGLLVPPGLPQLVINSKLAELQDQNLKEASYRQTLLQREAATKRYINRVIDEISNEIREPNSDKPTPEKVVNFINESLFVKIKDLNDIENEGILRQQFLKSYLQSKWKKYCACKLITSKTEQPLFTGKSYKWFTQMFETIDDITVKKKFVEKYPHLVEETKKDLNRGTYTRAVSKAVIQAFDQIVDPSDRVASYKGEILKKISRFEHESFQILALNRLIAHYQEQVNGVIQAVEEEIDNLLEQKFDNVEQLF